MKQASAMKQAAARNEARAVADQPVYLANFRLRDAPFQPEPDARFLYLSQAHARAQAYVEAAPAAGDPFVGLHDACRRIGNLFGWYTHRLAGAALRSKGTTSLPLIRRHCIELHFEEVRRQRGSSLALLAPSCRFNRNFWVMVNWLLGNRSSDSRSQRHSC